MKGFLAVGASLCFIVGASAIAHVPVHKSKKVSFGPQSCIKLSRSAEGSCVISTDCENVDTSQTEFAFNCIGEHIVRHSFGIGGFDAAEDFDTDVKCDRCDAPTPADAGIYVKPKHVEVKAVKVAKPSGKMNEKPDLKPEVQPVNFKAHETVKKVTLKRTNPTRPFDAKPKPAHLIAHSELKVVPAVKLNAINANAAKIWPFTSSRKTEADVSSDVVKYGPNECVSVYRNKEGHCVMATECKQADIASYNFGLLCVDKAGSSVKHLFGEDSFDPVESFDTLIKCEQCLGLENVPGATALAKEVVSMHKDISDIEQVVANISLNVKMLNDEVFKSKSAAPSPAPATAEAAAPSAAVLVHTAREHHSQKQHLRHSGKSQARHARGYDDDDTYDETDEKRDHYDAGEAAQGSSDSSDEEDDEDRDTDGSEQQDNGDD